MRQTFLTSCILLLLSPFLWGQRSQIDIAREVISNMDRNRDGRLEAGEIPLRSRAAVGRLAREAGMDLAQPLSIDKLKEQLTGQEGREAQERSERAATPPRNDTRLEGHDTVAGFGGESRPVSVAGFGAVDEAAADRSQADVPKVGSEAAASPAAGSAGDAADETRIRRYAAGLLKRYDANQNGVLDREEWSRMRGNPAESDTDKDGRLTVDELTVRLMDYSQNTTVASNNDSRSRARQTSQRFGTKNDKQRKSYRFLTPTERLADTLPVGLRDWFLRNDKNGDGQIAMSEFGLIWSRRKAIDFASYDQNNDGLITPREYLRAKTGVTTGD